MKPLGLYIRLEIEGVMPERALLRLKRAGIPLYDIRKTQKNRLLFTVKRKDSEKVFAIYPRMCYNRERTTAYEIVGIQPIGWAKIVGFCRKRAGLVLGALLFCASLTYASGLTLGVDFVGSTAYTRETLALLEEEGISLYKPYAAGREDILASRLLSLPFVEYASVKKVGTRIRVEIRLSPFQETAIKKGDMFSRYAGTLVNMTVLRGTPLKKAGEEIAIGEPLVGGWLEKQDGGQVPVEPIARVQIACAYEGVHAGDEVQAFAEAYLALSLSERDEIADCTLTPIEGGYEVKIKYLVVQTVNL